VESQGEELFRSIFEHAAIGMEQVAVDGRFLVVNAALRRMLGYSKSEFPGKTWEQITHPEDRDREALLVESMLRGERESYEIEKRYLHRDGSLIWANLTCSPVKDAAGKPLFLTSIVQDITARKRAEEALSESENAFDTLSNFVPQLVWMCTPDGLNIYFNQRWVDYTGLTLEESYGRGWNIPFHPDDKQLAWDAWNRAVQSGGECPYSVECRLRAADGSYRWFLIRGQPMCHAPGGVIRWFGTCTDIEDLRQRSEGRFRSVLDNSRDVIYRFNLQTGHYEYISPSAEAVVGYCPDELMALDLEASLAMIHPDDLPAVRESMARFKDTGEGELEYRQRTKYGDYHWMSNRMSLIKDDAGHPHYRDGNIRDITEHKRDEEERETTIEFLGLVNRSQGTKDLIQGAATFFQERSGCETVGIRLREGDDYPYFEARGFSKGFVIAENKLCVLDTSGKAVRDNLCNPILECMCGSVIGGRFDPSKPFFTARGCFWTNSTSELLASTSEADRQSRTRNRCNGEGYESVALIPLRDGEERFGLLQLNDRRKGRFSADIIALWERLAGYLAAALSKFRAEEALQQSEAQFRTLANSIPQLAWMANADGWVFWYNQRWYSYTGTTPEQMEGWGWQSVHDPNELPKVLEQWKNSIASGEPFDMVFPLRGADGVFRPFLTRVMPLFDSQGLV
jgi:PAS domain S-box-containing protein